MHRRCPATAFLLAFGGLALGIPSSTATFRGPQVGTSAPPTVEQVVERAGRYVTAYGDELSSVIGVERYSQWVSTSDAATVGQSGERPWTRATVSEFALVRVKEDWVGYRDVFQVDGNRLRDRQDRLQQLFFREPATAVDQGRRIADESARYNAGALQRNFNVPTMALFFLHPSNASRFTFKKNGEERLDGVVVWKVAYKETRKPTIIRTSAGKDMPVTGTFWIDPTSGRVLKTYLTIEDEARLVDRSKMADKYANRTVEPGQSADTRVPTFTRVTVDYKPDPRLGLLVPAEMAEEYQGLSAVAGSAAERVTRIRCRANYSDFTRFETSATVVPK